LRKQSVVLLNDEGLKLHFLCCVVLCNQVRKLTPYEDVLNMI